MDDKFECWFGWPWNDARNAAAFACELVRSVVPPRPTLRPVEVEVGEGPYRAAYVEVTSVEPNEVFDARCLVDHALAVVEDYARGGTPTAPTDFVSTSDDPMSRLYWWAREIGDRARQAAGCCDAALRPQRRTNTSSWQNHKTRRAGSSTTTDPEQTSEEKEQEHVAARWRVVGRATYHMTEFLQKFATGSLVVGAPDGVGNAILARVGREMIEGLGLSVGDVERRVLDWRIRDGLKDRAVSAEMRENLRLAFEAAWMVREYEFGYRLLEGLEQVAS